MLKISVQPLLNLRGVKYKVPYLTKLGVPYHTARHIAADNMSNFNLATIERLCVALGCTPNDLLFYTPSDDTIPADHPLRSLNMDRYKDEINEGVQQLNTAELELLKEQLRLILERKHK